MVFHYLAYIKFFNYRDKGEMRHSNILEQEPLWLYLVVHYTAYNI